MSPFLRFRKLTENAFEPFKGSDKSAGYDLKSAYDYVIPPNGRLLVLTDLQIAPPPGTYARIAPRSGLAVKHFIDVGAGVVDEDYRGNVGILLFNFGNLDFKVNRGDRVAQLVLEKIEHAILQECSTLDETDRGSGGFGSSGVN